MNGGARRSSYIRSQSTGYCEEAGSLCLSFDEAGGLDDARGAVGEKKLEV